LSLTFAGGVFGIEAERVPSRDLLNHTCID
jgi:hypothetical protein